jgi:hypothetical protein
MSPKILAITALASILTACGPAVGQTTAPETQPPAAPGPYMMGPGYGPGMMGQGYMMGPNMMYGQMGPGMMGPGYMMGPGMMGPGMMGQGMMGYGMGPYMMGRGGMMGYGPGYGPMGPGMMGRAAPSLDLSVADVKNNLERWLSFRGNPNLKVGKVQEKDKNTITAEIVTKENSLVRRYEIDRSTGFMRPVG